MESKLIDRAVKYAIKYLGLDSSDEVYIRNCLLAATHTKNYTESVDDFSLEGLDRPDVVIDPILDALIEEEHISSEEREYYLCYLLDILSLRPSAIKNEFDKIHLENPLNAFKYLHQYNIHNGYIKLTNIEKNIGFKHNDLEITINLSKPETTLKDVQKRLVEKPNYPKCPICVENVGNSNTTKQNLRGIFITLGGEEWFFQYSPYAYFNEHGIAINSKHTPMIVDETTCTKLLDFIDYIPDYFIGCNAGLPIIGGSILGHDHYQGGRYQLPIHKAKIKEKIKSGIVEISLLDWYNNVIHLESSSKDAINAQATKIILQWKKYFDEENNIYAYTNAQHSSVTVIALKKNDKYVLDLILRNNLTSTEFPDGIFHAHPEYFNIKKEGIGLIEAAGLFILPGRLKRQLSEVEEYLTNREYNSSLLSEDMLIHQSMIERLIEKSGTNNSKEAAQQIIKDELYRICANILDNVRVFKKTETGNKGMEKFLASLNLEENK